ncbi:MAG: metalloregulator ArsR/SmtB family transcription factor, partial [Chloroflexota bacterium]|nr:metalloregulator ArsR/SmtB family transcription factor [Chloroflexota bacterium]
LLEGFWTSCFEQEYTRVAPELRRAVQVAQGMAHPAVQVSFSELTGHRLPPEIENVLSLVDRVLYCPSSHLDDFIQYIFYPPVLILYFNARTVLEQRPAPVRILRGETERLDSEEILDGLRALSDPSRMRIIEMLRDGEMYAQEIVAKLGISQSAVSRHLSTLEAADIITVRPSNGMKYYAIDRSRLLALATHLETLAEAAQPTLVG